MEEERSTAQAREAVATRTLPDGRIFDVTRLLWGMARLGVILPEDRNLGIYSDVWDYQTVLAALTAMEQYDGANEPAGWHRHPASGRRRPNGDSAREHIRP